MRARAATMRGASALPSSCAMRGPRAAAVRRARPSTMRRARPATMRCARTMPGESMIPCRSP